MSRSDLYEGDEVLLILYTRREIKKQRFKCWSDQFIIILIRETGKGRRAIEKRGKKQELREAGIVTTRIQQRSRCTTFRWSEVEAAGEEREQQRGRPWAASRWQKEVAEPIQEEAAGLR